jgi:magnesium transporter
MFETIQNHPIASQLDQYTFEELLQHIESDFEHLDPIKLARTSPYEVGRFLERLTVQQCKTVLKKLSEEKASEVLAEMDSEDSAAVISAMREFRAVKILELLDPDDAADLISDLAEHDRSRLLHRLAPATSLTIRKLLKYDPDTAGGVMTTHFVTLKETFTTTKAIEVLRKHYKKGEDFYDLYIVDAQNLLKGITSIKDLMFSPPETVIRDIMKTELSGLCYPEQDKEDVARSMAEFNSQAIPVVDHVGHLLGIVTHDDVIDIIQEEATEDIQMLHGAGADENVHDRVIYSLKKRNPWLMINLGTAFLAAGVISKFSAQITQYSLLAAFMTIVANLGGNTGAQTLAVTIRGLALDEFHAVDIPRIFLKEIAKGLLNGLIIGLFSSALAWYFSKNFRMGLTVFLAMVLNMGLSCVVGAAIPIILKRCRCDPAQSSYIFLTAVTDIVGLLTFLTLGSWLIL